MSLAVGDTDTTLDALPVEIGIATMLNRDERLYIRADKSIPYGELIGVMNVLRAEGYLRVGLVGLDEIAAPGDAPAPDGPPQ